MPMHEIVRCDPSRVSGVFESRKGIRRRCCTQLPSCRRDCLKLIGELWECSATAGGCVLCNNVDDSWVECHHFEHIVPEPRPLSSLLAVNILDRDEVSRVPAAPLFKRTSLLRPSNLLRDISPPCANCSRGVPASPLCRKRDHFIRRLGFCAPIVKHPI